MDTVTIIRIVAGVLAVVVLFIIIWRRRRKVERIEALSVRRARMAVKIGSAWLIIKNGGAVSFITRRARRLSPRTQSWPMAI